jgi:hypothetical protein
MIALELSRERRARIWFTAPADYVTQPSSLRSVVLTPASRIEVHRSSIVVEMFVPAGGRFHYGLLGATVIEPGGPAREELVLEVAVMAARGPIYDSSLAGTLDTVRWGLPSEYTDAVIESVTEAMGAHGAPDVSRLRFAYGAHGDIGSSRAFFGRLARLVLSLMTASMDTDLRGLADDA